MNNSDPVQELTYPQFDACSSQQPPQLPSSWQCTALLHPFSPPPQNEPCPDNPFFNLCVASIAYVENEGFSAQIISSDGLIWWYKIKSDSNITTLSRDEGATWEEVEVGWSSPSTNWLAGATCIGNSYLNWMQAQKVDWWKKPASEHTNPNAATWFWFNTSGSEVNFPFRIMFGAPPPCPSKGTLDQLALFQMYSFTYLTNFSSWDQPLPETWSNPCLEGFTFGNVRNLQPVVWSNNFGMTTFMTPVNHESNPLPTRVLYRWAADQDYQVLTDRAQSTLMQYTYNQEPNNPSKDTESQDAYLYGVAPKEAPNPPVNSGSGFLYTQKVNTENHKIGIANTCKSLPLGQEAPNWSSIEEGDPIKAIIDNHPTLCPGQTITVLGLIFPPTDEYPQGRYLWTWYSPFSLVEDGSHCRPVTFMESASSISEGGTSLALADYYNYLEFDTEVSSRYFQLPNLCKTIRKDSPVHSNQIYSNYKHTK